MPRLGDWNWKISMVSMKDYRLQLEDIFQRLQTGDAAIRNKACDDAKQLISQLDDENKKNYVRQSVLIHFIERGRFAEASEMILALRNSIDQNQQLFSYFINIEFWKKQENQADQVEKAIQETITYTGQIDIPGAKAEAYSIYGSFLIQKCNPREAITWFSKAAAIAEDTHNSNLLALTKYYTGICLYKLGRHAMANSYLREATEIAFQEKNHVIAQHSELMRAVVLMDQGKTDQCHEILRQWEHHFALNLC